jgi:anti-sigma B factor antagonist
MRNRVPFSTVSEQHEPDPAPEGMSILRHEVDGVLVIAVTGDIDLESTPALREAVTAGIDHAGGEPCVLDLTAGTFLGSSGLAALVELTGHAEARRVPLRIVVDANRSVIRPIEITGLDDVLRLYHSVDEAVRAGR